LGTGKTGSEQLHAQEEPYHGKLERGVESGSPSGSERESGCVRQLRGEGQQLT